MAGIPRWHRLGYVHAIRRIYRAFESATAFNGDISGWDTGERARFDAADLLQCNDAFNQDIGGWDVRNVTRHEQHCLTERDRLFNQDISGWETGNVTNMSSECSPNATAFNQDLNTVRLVVETTAADAWDTSSVTNRCRDMF